jgi:hypothetical protein
MSDLPPSDRTTDILLRAALPGRAALEGAVLLAAFAILLPACAPGALACALRARRRGHRQWRAAAAAALWCGFLGVALRLALGAPVLV